MSSVNLSWDADGTIDFYTIYRSESPMSIESLPAPLAENVLDKTYSDITVVDGITYYYRVASVRGGDAKVSDEVMVKKVSAGDEHWDKVVALLHIDGDLLDVCGNTWAAQGGMQLSYTDPKFGSGCVYSDGSYNSNLHMTSPIPKLLNDDFCIEMFYKPVNTNTWYSIFNTYGVGNTAERNITVSNNYGQLTGSLVTITGNNAFTLNKWHHIAYTRQGINLRLFLDGVLVGSGNITESVRTDAIYIGLQPYNPDWAVPGFYDELRITKGIARYTANFTPPDAPFPSN